MDNRTRASLDNYITGGRYEEAMVDVVCKECEHRFEWRVCYEYGASWYKPEEVKCPKCGADYDEEDNECG